MKYWKTKTGEKLEISKMETSHIENCIKMLERTMPDFGLEIEGMLEHDFNWSASQLDAEEKRWQRMIDSFKRELKKRGAK